MNHLLTAWTIFILAASIDNNEALKPNANLLKITNAYSRIYRTTKPQIFSAIPLSIVEKKYIAKVAAVDGNSISYCPYFTARKIKFSRLDAQLDFMSYTLN